MIVIAGIAGWFNIRCPWHMFQHPHITVDIVPFDLMGSGGCAPEKAFWKFHLWVHRLPLHRAGLSRSIPVEGQPAKTCVFKGLSGYPLRGRSAASLTYMLSCVLPR